MNNPRPGFPPEPEPAIKWRMAGIAVAALLFLMAMTQCSQAEPGDQVEAAPPQLLDEAVVAQCRDLLETGRRAGVIREEPSPQRINVDDRLWSAMPASEKDVLLQAVSCVRWRSSMPPAGEQVAAYGWRSGKRVQMLTEVGMIRE